MGDDVQKPSCLVPFNPLDKRNLGQSVLNALTTLPLKPLGQMERFSGAGVYAIYFVGTKCLYEPLRVESSRDRPIYVGKAIPSGARKGGSFLNLDPGEALYNRLREHADSINEVYDLNVDDFLCRYLAVDDVWIPLAESLLITKYLPLLNVVIEGFGNHDPGKGRTNQQRSLWDTMHPGRKWAEKLRNSKLSRQEIMIRIQNWMD